MKTLALLIMVAMMILPFKIIAITPVHLGKVIIDTSIYERNFISYFAPGPFTSVTETGAAARTNSMMVIKAFRIKNSNKFDLYSYTGKIGTTIIPFTRSGSSPSIKFSCNIVDDDAGWEALVTYGTINPLDNNVNYYFDLFDDDGRILLSDSGEAYYGVDLNNTYVITYQNDITCMFNTWRFRTNISTESPKSLTKTKSIQPSLMQIYGLPGGDYRVTLSPSSGNQINFQMFDLLGRCVFDKQIQNLTSPVSFTVPEGNVPNSPFIAKVNDGNGSVVKKQIPVK